jgi:hypothetical protein
MKRHLAKRLIFFGLIIFLGLFLLCPEAKALEVGLNEISKPLGLGREDVRVTMAKIINLSLGILGLIDLLIIIVAGALYLSALGDSERIAKAKKILIYAGTGLIIVLAAFSITNFIINELIGATGVELAKNENEAAAIYSCTGEDPANAYLCDYDDWDLTANTPKTLVSDPSLCTDERKCEYYCDIWSGYTLLDGSCQVSPYTCTGNDPANAYLCDYDDVGLKADTLKILVAECTDEKKCEYTCASGYMLFNGKCEQSCRGLEIANATLCNYDNVNLPAPLDKTLVESCTDAKKCEYTCKYGFILIGGSCQKNPCPVGFYYTGGICKATGFVEITVDNGYQLYLNGSLIGSAGRWEDIETYKINFVSGTNVFAIKAIDFGEVYGLVARVGYGSQTYFVTKGGNFGWKCLNLNTAQPDPTGWQDINYNDSTWVAPKTQTDIWSGSGRLEYKIPGAEWIWTPTGGSLTRILCRYKYTF